MASPDIHFEIIDKLPNEEVIELYKAGGWWEESAKAREILPAMIKGSFCFMVASHGKRIVGMGRVISDGVSDAYIQDIVVKEEYRGLHIGKELVKRLAQYCVDHGLEWIGLVSEPNAIAFYEHLGFRVLKGYKPMLLQKELLQ